jgi:hypothetical protein
LKNIDKLSKLFNKTQILVFYDISNDRSLDILLEYKNNLHSQTCDVSGSSPGPGPGPVTDDANTNVNIEITINARKVSNNRVENISHARNALLDIIRTEYRHYEYFIMMDSNEYSCIGDMNTGVISDILQRTDWDAVSFDREAGYYDTWALSFKPYVYSFFHFSNWRQVVEMMRAQFNRVLEEYKNNTPDELMPVYSAFNGFAIYKTAKFINCRYSSTINVSLFPNNLIILQKYVTGCEIINHLEGDCEHRHFHLESIKKNGARIRICTKSVFAKFPNPPAGLRGPC